MGKITIYLILFAGGILVFAGCSGTRGNDGNLSIYSVPAVEAEWIRNGKPIEFEGDFWFPRDGFDVLLDSEVFLIGEFKGVQFFVAKEDVRPFERLYTKFGRDRYRAFRKENYDKSP